MFSHWKWWWEVRVGMGVKGQSNSLIVVRMEQQTANRSSVIFLCPMTVLAVKALVRNA